MESTRFITTHIGDIRGLFLPTVRDQRAYGKIIQFFLSDKKGLFISVLLAVVYIIVLGLPVVVSGITDSIIILSAWAISLNLMFLAIKFSSLRLSNDRTDIIRKAFVNHVMHTGVAENQNMGSSSRMWLNSTALDQISASGAAIYGQLITGALVLTVQFVLLCTTLGWLALIALPIALALWLTNHVSVRNTKKNFEEHHANGRLMNAEIQNLVSNDIYYKAIGLFTSRAQKLYGLMLSQGMNVMRIRSQQQLSTLINQSLVILTFLLLANSFKTGLSVTQVMVWTVLTLEIRKHMLAFLQALGVIVQGGLSYSKIEDHLLLEQGCETPTNEMSSWTAIAWTTLRFCYPESTRIHLFEPFSLTKGSRAWIKGRNGAGKSTLWKLILGFYSPSQGCVQFIPSGSSVSFRSLRIGIVTEPVLVLPGVLWEFLGSERMTRPEVEEAVTALGFQSFIAQITDGFDHVLGMEQKKLSKGQTKVIMFLQAIISTPEVLVLDEPFASVDAHWCERMTSVIAALPQATTVLLISHQPAALHCDTTIQLDS